MWHDIKALNATANILMGLVLVALVSSGIWWLVQRPMFTLKIVQIESSQQSRLRHVNALTIREAALPKVKGNFFTANLDSVRSAFEAVPWVRRASVQRDWPNKLIVTLEEHEVLGTWGDAGRLLSVRGDVFTANLAEAEEDADLVNLNGPEGSEKEVLAHYIRFKDWFKKMNLAPEIVNYSARYAWSVTLNNGMRVELGRTADDESLKKRVDTLMAVYPKLLASLQDQIESVDLRYPNGLALKSSLRGLNELKLKNKQSK